MSELTQSQWSARLTIAYLMDAKGITKAKAYALLNVAKAMGIALTYSPVTFRTITVKFDGTTYTAY